MKKMGKRYCGLGVVLILIVYCVVQSLYSQETKKSLPQPSFEIADTGAVKFIDYTKYGKYKNPGTSSYKYVVADKEGLIKALGAGIFPGSKKIFQDPAYKYLKEKGRFKGSYWKHVKSGDPAADFFTWATCSAEPGLKLFYAAEALKAGGHIVHAIKAYQALTVLYPGSSGWNGGSQWYMGPVAIRRIRELCKQYPSLGVSFVDATIVVKDHEVFVLPGRFVSTDKAPKNPRLFFVGPVVRGLGMVQLRRYDNGHWQMFVNDQPFVVKAVNYSIARVGESPHLSTMQNWQYADRNKNGVVDINEVWIDKNKNNKQDPGEKLETDFSILKRMGCNAIRIYHNPPENKYDSKVQFNKVLLRQMHDRFGIRVIMGDFLGAYTISSGANWNVGTDYTDKAQCARMKANLRKLVMDHKDEPYVLMWVLGNENNLKTHGSEVNATRTMAASQPEAYARFLQECARMIHEIDPDHPVAVGNAELFLSKYYGKHAKEVDIFGINAYRGIKGFGTLWKDARANFDRPILITEYGCDAWDFRHKKEDEFYQAQYHRSNWLDIVNNLYGKGEGNSIGGVAFEYLDEWWKSLKGSAFTHDPTLDCILPFQDGWSSEEYLGIFSQGNGKLSPFIRQPRLAYYYYLKAWNGSPATSISNVYQELYSKSNKKVASTNQSSATNL